MSDEWIASAAELARRYRIDRRHFRKALKHANFPWRREQLAAAGWTDSTPYRVRVGGSEYEDMCRVAEAVRMQDSVED